EAEVIFGHGIDPDLKECIRVTIIATGFDNDDFKTIKNERKKVIDLESNRQISLFDEESYKKTKRVVQDTDEKKKSYVFQRPISTPEEKPENIFSDLGSEYDIVERHPIEPEEQN